MSLSVYSPGNHRTAMMYTKQFDRCLIRLLQLKMVLLRLGMNL